MEVSLKESSTMLLMMEKLQKPMLTSSQDNMVKILPLLTEISKSKDKKKMNNQKLQICLN